MTNRFVVIDAGHGGSAPAGKSSAYGQRAQNGTLEKDVNLALASAVANHLGGDAVLTRSDDRNLSLAERCEVARRLGAGVFVSLRAGGGPEGGRGARAFAHPRSSPASRALARSLGSALEGGEGPELADLAVLTPERHAPGTAACLICSDSLIGPGGRPLPSDHAELGRLGRAFAAGIERFRRGASFGRAHLLPNLNFGPRGPGGRPLGAVSLLGEPVRGMPAQIAWTDYNDSDTMAGSYTDRVFVTDAANNTVWSQEVWVENGLPVDGNASHSVAWTPDTAGNFTVHVRLNSSSMGIPEDTLDDNESTVNVRVWESNSAPPAQALDDAGAGMVIREVTSTDGLTAIYRDDQNVGYSNYDHYIAARRDYQNRFVWVFKAVNAGLDADVQIRFYDNDPSQQGATQIGALPLRRLTLAAGGSLVLEFTRLPSNDRLYYRIPPINDYGDGRAGSALYFNVFG